ncbi:hypothetical protein QIW53_02760 [Pseudomonas fluorescens]|jgi:hypothetical protein|uniref:hypothetical protein n=1 Tax=Pseudomonas fluorescens TaxID=294 RepID=UPI0035257828
MNLTYRDPSMSHDEAVKLLASGVEANVISALTSIGLNEADRIWAQNVCIDFLASETEAVAASAITALGHLVRRCRKLDNETVLGALSNAKHRFPKLEGVVADTLDDIETFA